MLYCPRCKRNQYFYKVNETALLVTYQCSKCGKTITVPKIRREK